MSYILVVFSFLIFYICAFFLDAGKLIQNKKKNVLLFVVCLGLAYIAGMRGLNWTDTEVYYWGFANHTVTLDHYSILQEPWGYDEGGFYFISVLVKTFINNARVFLLLMSALSMYLLYRFDKKYCIYPFLGICIYVARFFLNRNMGQMRTAISIPLVLMALYLVKNRQMLKFFLIVFVAYTIHRMSLLAIPFYFLNLIKIKKIHIIICLSLSFVFAITMSGEISYLAELYSKDLNYSTYVSDEYISEMGLMNPMIYYQIIILLLFTFREKYIRSFTDYYDILRNGYFYSTCILILFSQYSALSGRTSTFFATLEMGIIPIIGKSFEKNRIIYFSYYFILGGVLAYFLYSKYLDVISDVTMITNQV